MEIPHMEINPLLIMKIPDLPMNFVASCLVSPWPWHGAGMAPGRAGRSAPRCDPNCPACLGRKPQKGVGFGWEIAGNFLGISRISWEFTWMIEDFNMLWEFLGIYIGSDGIF